MSRVFVDSGAWIALLRRDDDLHGAAEEAYLRLRAERAQLLTTNYVIDESATRLRYDAGLSAALGLRQMLSDAMRTDLLHLVWVDRRIEGEAWDVLAGNEDVELSLTDATSFVVAKRNRVGSIFSFDSDFRALGLELIPG